MGMNVQWRPRPASDLKTLRSLGWDFVYKNVFMFITCVDYADSNTYTIAVHARVLNKL